MFICTSQAEQEGMLLANILICHYSFLFIVTLTAPAFISTNPFLKDDISVCYALCLPLEVFYCEDVEVFSCHISGHKLHLLIQDCALYTICKTCRLLCHRLYIWLCMQHTSIDSMCTLVVHHLAGVKDAITITQNIITYGHSNYQTPTSRIPYRRWVVQFVVLYLSFYRVLV